MAIGMKQVAMQAGVSVATVSNVLNRPGLVSQSTIDRVQRVIDATGFVPNGSARQLRVGTSPMVNVIVPDISNPFFADLTRGVEQEAVKRGLAVFVSSTEGDLERERRYLNIVLEQRSRGLLFTPAGDLDGPLATIQQRVPVVLIDHESAGGLCSVAVDDFRGGGLAVQHLHSLGHRNLTWVVGPDSIPQCAQRSAGVKYAAAQYGIDVTEVRTEAMTVADGKSAGSLLGMPTDREHIPTAVVCANDLLALGVEFGLMASGVDVPGETSIIGFDDIEFASSAAVTLTSISRPAAQIGSTAFTMLLDETTSPDHIHRQVQFQPHLTIRQSTARPRTAT